LTPEEAVDDAQITARGMVLRDDGLTQFAPPLKLSDHEFSIRQAAPKAGEHSAEILRAAGYSDTQIDRLQATGVFG